MKKQNFIGIDGGATYIRVAVADYEGNILSHIKYQGGAAIQKNEHPQENMRNAVLLALEEANVCPEDVIAIGAGISGYDGEEDLVWLNTLIEIKGFNCTIKYVNDAEIAHIGAFNEKGGIIAICGTGSIVFGMDEYGNKIRNYDFDVYAHSAARHLTQKFINRVVNGENDITDDDILAELSKFLNIESIEAISMFASDENGLKRTRNPKRFGEFAKYITEYALRGSRLAQIVCKDSADEICSSIELVGKHFNPNIVDVALVGSVANSKYIFDYINETLSKKGYNVKHNVLSPELGGIILAMKASGIIVDETKLENLRKFT